MTITEDGRATCTVQGCSESLPDATRARRHVKSHFGHYIFCPACGTKLKGGQEEFSLKRHFLGNQKCCYEKLYDLGWVDENGNRLEQWKSLFNLYYLGLFDHLPIHDEHYSLVAGRSRTSSQ